MFHLGEGELTYIRYRSSHPLICVLASTQAVERIGQVPFWIEADASIQLDELERGRLTLTELPMEDLLHCAEVTPTIGPFSETPTSSSLDLSSSASRMQSILSSVLSRSMSQSFHVLKQPPNPLAKVAPIGDRYHKRVALRLW